jgi:hypothetical protein
MQDFSKYKISCEQIGPEHIPFKLTIPIEALRDNSEILKPYQENDEWCDHVIEIQLRELYKKYGIDISPQFNWVDFLNREIIPYVKPDLGNLAVNEFGSFGFDDKNISLECILINSKWAKS